MYGYAAKNDAYRHRTKVASHTATPLGVAKWLVRGCPEEYSLPLGRRHGLLVPLTWAALVPYLKARFKIGRHSHQPFRGPQGDNCMAGYHCLMPTALFHCNPITNLSILPRCYPRPIYQHFLLQNIPPINISHYNTFSMPTALFLCNSFPIYRHSFKKRSGAYTAARSAFHYLR